MSIRKVEVTHEVIRYFNSHLILQRQRDGYFNATAMCQATGRLWADYNRLESTKAFIDALATETGYPISELIQSVRGGYPTQQGTWVHPYVAINLAQWCSPEFAVQVSKWVYEVMTYGTTPARLSIQEQIRLTDQKLKIMEKLTKVQLTGDEVVSLMQDLRRICNQTNTPVPAEVAFLREEEVR